jgi:transcriptional antiterminator NusG
MSDEPSPGTPTVETAIETAPPPVDDVAHTPSPEPAEAGAVHAPLVQAVDSGSLELSPGSTPVAAVESHTSFAAPAETAKIDEPPPPKPARKAKAAKAAAASPAAIEPSSEPAQAPEPDPAPEAAAAPPIVENKKKWYAIKVQSGREDSIKAAILRKVRIEGLEEYFGRIEIPVEEVSDKKQVKVKDKKTGEYSYQEKKVIRKKKKFQGYLFAELEFNDRILYLFRETSGVGDFLNLRTKPNQPPTPEPMPEHEVQSMLTGVAMKDPNKKVQKIDLEKGDKVRIREGSFANYEGEVKAIIEAKDPNEVPKVTVMLTFWGRPLDVELDSSQVEKV